jgi:phenol 2-monooxygenase
MNILDDLDKKGHRLTETSFWARDSAGALVRNFTGVEVVHGKFSGMRKK